MVLLLKTDIPCSEYREIWRRLFFYPAFNLYSFSFQVFQKFFIRQLTTIQHFWDIKTLFEGLAYEGERKA